MTRVWVDSTLSIQVASSGQDSRSLITGFSAADTRLAQMTLLRTIIGVDIAYTVHDSGEGSQKVSLGIGITSQEAFAAGTLPDPVLATDYPTRPWIWRAEYRVFGFAADQPTIFTRRLDLDIRAMRKLENGEVFIVVDNFPIEGVTASITVLGLIRQLWNVT